MSPTTPCRGGLDNRRQWQRRPLLSLLPCSAAVVLPALATLAVTSI